MKHSGKIPGQSTSQSTSQSVTKPVTQPGQSTSQPASHSASNTVNRPLSQSLSQSLSHSLTHSIIQSAPATNREPTGACVHVFLPGQRRSDHCSRHWLARLKHPSVFISLPRRLRIRQHTEAVCQMIELSAIHSWWCDMHDCSNDDGGGGNAC